MLGRTVYALGHLVAATVVFAAGVLVPLPFTHTAPGGAVEISPLLTISDAEVTELSGETLLLTINIGRPSTAELVRALVDDAHDVSFTSQFGALDEGFFEGQRVRFRQSLDLAAAVGARAAGYDVEVQTGAFIFQVVEGAPAGGVLEAGDTIVAVRGEPVRSAQQVVEAASDLEVGGEVELTVLRDGERVEVAAPVGRISDGRGGTKPGLGVFLQTVAAGVDLPFAVEPNETRIGGPSAGMMIALTVYDILAEEDLLAGRAVAGTGEILPDGVVAPVSGVGSKTIGAERAGADLILVPTEQAEQARATAQRIEVVGVDTLQDAIDALRARPAAA